MYKMTTKSGEEILVASFDGGGCFVGSYDYDVAYMVADGGGYDEGSSKLILPASLTKKQGSRTQNLAIDTSPATLIRRTNG